jgi:Uma2 family endonuclease
MVKPAHDRRQALYDAYLDVPAGQHAEIINGTLYLSPRPGPQHSNATAVLLGDLNPPFQRGRGGPGGWWIINEPELHLDALEPLQPDICGWRVERMPGLPEESFFTLAPDWICEVLSPSTEARDRGDKLSIYASHRVGHVWLVDPIRKLLEVYVLDPERRWREVRTYQGSTVVRAAPFDAIEIELAALWG